MKLVSFFEELKEGARHGGCFFVERGFIRPRLFYIMGRISPPRGCGSIALSTEFFPPT